MSPIRPAEPGELAPLCDQITAMEPWLRLGVTANNLLSAVHSDPLRKTWVLEDAGHLKGCIMFRTHDCNELLARRGLLQGLAAYYKRQPQWPAHCYPDGGYVNLVATLPGFQGEGLGLQLLLAAESETAPVTDRLYLSVSESNGSARRFYERNGYDFLAPVENCIKPGNTENLMRKILVQR